MESLKIVSSTASDTDRDMFPLERASEVFPNAYHLAAHSGVGSCGTYVLHLDLCRNAAVIAAALSDERIVISDSETLKIKMTIKSAHEKTLCGIRFAKSEEHKLFSGSHDGTIKLWDLRSCCSKPAVTFEQTKATTVRPLTSFDLSCDGRTVVAGTEQVQRDSFLLFWGAADPGGELRGGYWDSHEDDITAVRFHPEKADLMASGGTDGIVNVFDISRETEEDALETSINSESSVQRLAWFSKDGADALCCLTHVRTYILTDDRMGKGGVVWYPKLLFTCDFYSRG